jgi:hypothetical protein
VLPRPKKLWLPKSKTTHFEPAVQWSPIKPLASDKEETPITEKADGNKSSISVGTSLDSRNDAYFSVDYFTQEQDSPYFSSSPPPTQTQQENPTHPPSTAVGEDCPSKIPMVNFPVNPAPFLVAGLMVNHGWNRPARGRMALGGEPTREHEDYAIVRINPMPQDPA